MDPVSGIGLAASVGQLADLAFKVFTNLHKYYRDFEEAPRRSKQLRKEVKRMFTLATDLYELFEAHPRKLQRPSLVADVREFNEMLQEMLGRTSVERSRGLQRFKWPFKEVEHQEFLRKIERFKSSFSLVISIMQRYNLRKVLNFKYSTPRNSGDNQYASKPRRGCASAQWLGRRPAS